MPPRRNTRSVTTAERATSALSPLPLAVVLHIFSLLPVDCRLRCSKVCRGWRHVLLERSLWTRLDLSTTSGVRASVWVLDALLRCAAARAGGGLQSLHVNKSRVTNEALMEVAAANAGALRELHAFVSASGGFSAGQVAALCGAAPQLRVFTTDMACSNTDVEAARTALRNEAPFGPLRVRHLTAYDLRQVNEAGVVAFAADVAAHASLCGLELQSAPLNTPAAVEAVVDAALVRRVHTFSLRQCGLSPASAPALARLLTCDALTTLNLSYCSKGDDGMRPLFEALPANTHLRTLDCSENNISEAFAANVLLPAVRSNVGLRELVVGRAWAAAREAAQLVQRRA
jgi:hypothetical protein